MGVNFMLQINIMKVDKDVPTPKYAHQDDAAMDVYSAENYVLQPGERKIISTGLKFDTPVGYEIQIRPRSGLSLKHGIAVLNSPGTIDAGYRGVVGILLINHGKEPFEIKKCDRIAQITFHKVISTELIEVNEISEATDRGAGGFGSTGK